MKKVFISQPMRGLSDEEITAKRAHLVEIARSVEDGDLEILDSFFQDFDGNALAFLGKSISLLSEADLAVFGEGWQDARGCQIEHLCCMGYDIQVIEEITKEESKWFVAAHWLVRRLVEGARTLGSFLTRLLWQFLPRGQDGK